MQTPRLLWETLHFTEVLLHLERVRLISFIVVACETRTMSVLNIALLSWNFQGFYQ